MLKPVNDLKVSPNSSEGHLQKFSKEVKDVSTPDSELSSVSRILESTTALNFQV
jgi:hypothetical protein